MTPSEWFANKIVKYKKEELLTQYSQFIKDTGSNSSEESFKRRIRSCFPEKENTKVELSKDEIDVKEENSGDTYQAFVTSTWIKTPEQLIEYLNIDSTKWILSKFTRNIWGSDDHPNIQVKGEFKLIDSKEPRIEDILSIIKESVETFKPSFLKKDVNVPSTGNMLEIAIEDQHFGQLSLESETGSNYNLDIAHNNYINAVNYFLEYSKGFKPEKIVFVIGSDFFNVDNPANTTYAGTPQDEVSTWKNTFKKGLETCIEAIETCYKYVNNIDIKVVQGNHDYTRSFYLGVALQQRYSKVKSINVDVSDEPRKYESWGTNLICFTHGDKETISKMPIIIGKEKPKEFAEAKFIEAHCGHLHAEKDSLVFVNEDAIIKYRVLPSLVCESQWSKQKGLFHLRESKAFVWNKEQGNIASFNYHV